MASWEEAEHLADDRADEHEAEGDEQEADENLRAASHLRNFAMSFFPWLIIQTPTRALGG